MKKRTVNEAGRNVPQPIRSDGAGAIDSGPRNVMRDIQNPNMLVPPITDAGLVPNLKFSHSARLNLNERCCDCFGNREICGIYNSNATTRRLNRL
ncbi:hypothetical protein ACUOCP_46095, partial [Escherichia sp. R-CC3]